MSAEIEMTRIGKKNMNTYNVTEQKNYNQWQNKNLGKIDKEKMDNDHGTWQDKGVTQD